jgi:hypothetical protein
VADFDLHSRRFRVPTIGKTVRLSSFAILLFGGLLVASSAHGSTPRRTKVGAHVTNAAKPVVKGFWTPKGAPQPYQSGKPPGMTLDSVACVSARSCTAVGTYRSAYYGDQGVLEVLAGGKWRAKGAPMPSDTPNTDNVELASVACPSLGSCEAVGSYDNLDGPGGGYGLLESSSNGPWSALQAPVPPNAKTNPADAGLDSVACVSAGSCEAVGAYYEPSGEPTGLMESLSGGTWTAAQAPLPANADTNQYSLVLRITCESDGSCEAAGDYLDSSGHLQGLLETLSDGTWSPTEAPLPADATSNPNAVLDAVTCASSTSCAAAGTYEDSAGNTNGVLETLSDGSWSASEAPVPGNADSDLDVTLTSIACPAAGPCEAVGTYNESGSGSAEGLLETLSDNTWSATEAPLPADADSDPAVTLTSVTCSSAGSCEAVGAYDQSSDNGYGEALIETLSLGTWTATAAPLPGKAAQYDSALESITCLASGTCLAVGRYDVAAGGRGLIERYHRR